LSFARDSSGVCHRGDQRHCQERHQGVCQLRFIAVTEKTIRLEGKDNSDNILSTAISSLMLELIRLINPSRECRVVLIEHFLNPLQLAGGHP
jgi:hypothetical protein